MEGDSQCLHGFFFGVMFLFNVVKTLQARTDQLMSSCFHVWQTLGAQQSTKHHEFDDCIFAPTTETSGKITTELGHEDELEENSRQCT